MNKTLKNKWLLAAAIATTCAAVSNAGTPTVNTVSNTPAATSQEATPNPDDECCCACVDLTINMPTNTFCVGPDCRVSFTVTATANSHLTWQSCSADELPDPIGIHLSVPDHISLSVTNFDLAIGATSSPIEMWAEQDGTEACEDQLIALGCYDEKEGYTISAVKTFMAVEIEDITGVKCVPMGGAILLSAETKPPNWPVAWSVVATNNLDSSWPVKATLTETNDPSLGICDRPVTYARIDAAEDSGLGSLVVRAQALDVDASCSTNCIMETRVPVRCPTCGQDQGVAPPAASSSEPYSTCPGGSCSAAGTSQMALGTGSQYDKNIQAKFSVGALTKGKSAGYLCLDANDMSLNLATPSALVSGTMPGDVEIKRSANGALRQTKAPQALADIETIDNFKYEIRFYYSSDVGGTNGLGLYTNNAGPFVTWIVENPAADTNDCFTLRISEVSGSTTNSTQFSWDDTGAGKWWFSRGNGLGHLTREEALEGTDREVTWKTLDAQSNLVQTVQTTYRSYSWGEVPIEEIIDPDGLALTTTFTHDEAASENNHSASGGDILSPTGDWETRLYDAQGWITNRIQGWKDIAQGADADQVRSTIYHYQLIGGSGDDGTLPGAARTVTEKIQDAVIAKTFHVYMSGAQETTQIVERAATATADYGDDGNARSITVRYNMGLSGPEADKIKSVTYPDGRFDSYVYERGNYATNSGPSACSFSADSTGAFVRVTVTHGLTNETAGVANRTTREQTVEDPYGNLVLQETRVHTGADYERIDWTVTYFDQRNRPTVVHRSDGTLIETTWNCCGKESEKDAQGMEFLYTYDAFRRMNGQRKLGIAEGDYAAQTNIDTTYFFDTAGRTIATTNSATSLSIGNATWYDASGRMTQSIDQAGLVVQTFYIDNGLIVETCGPGGITNRIENYLDGRTKCTRINDVIQSWTDYGVDADDGTQWTVTYAGPGGTNSPAWSRTTTDVLGRTMREERPGFDGAVITNAYTYNSKGQLIKTQISGFSPQPSPTLYEYDILGNQVLSGLDIDADDTLDLSGPDRVSTNDSFYAEEGSDWWRVSLSMVYAQESGSAPTTNSLQKTQLTGLSASMTVKSLSIDIRGNTNTSTTAVDRSAKKVTQTVDYPESTNDAISVTVNGLLQTSESKTGLEYAYLYDALARQTGVTDPRSGTSSTEFNDKGQVDWVEDAASNKTWFVYDEETGRQIALSNALGKIARYEHDARGNVIRTWGETEYPLSQAFDDYNRATNMGTYRGGTGWGNWDWPADPGTADLTTWKYDEATGLMTNKLYADGKGPSYTYTPDGELETRNWARGVTTTYLYTNTTGELVGIDYDDSTPDVSFSFDRLGRQVLITDGQGTRSFAYSEYLELTNEVIVSAATTSVLIRTQDSLGRQSALTVGPPLVGAPHSVQYGFDTLGRFSCLTSAVSSATNAWTYSYLGQSDLVSGWSNTVNGAAVSRSFESQRDLITQIENKVGTNLISRYEYGNDALGRRTQRIDTTSAVSTNTFQYNARSELTNAAMGTHTFAWALDNIGNRDAATADSQERTFLCNALNQYTNIHNGTTNALWYDLDGNLTNDGHFAFTYNGENRLISAEPLAPTNGSKKVESAYDYMGRRWQKVVWTRIAGEWASPATDLFLYDGYLLVREDRASAANASTNFYVRGLDLAGSLQGAGGIGGLLSCTLGTNSYLYFGDANGNITELAETNGTVVARYAWDAYGNRLNAPGENEPDQPYGYSSQYQDKETGLWMYIFRPYSPVLERWLSMDLIGDSYMASTESGGQSIEGGQSSIELLSRSPYPFVNNEPIRHFDPSGLQGMVAGNAPPDIPVPGAQVIETSEWRLFPEVHIVDVPFFGQVVFKKWGDTTPKIPKIEMEVTPQAGEGGGCWNLSWKSMTMTIHYWWVVWKWGAASHEKAHGADCKQMIFLPSVKYVFDVTGTYKTKATAECWKETASSYAPRKFFYCGVRDTIAKQDDMTKQHYKDQWNAFNAECQVSTQSLEAQEIECSKKGVLIK